MNNYKLTFKLKQHTPHINFQSSHQGSTIRATDIKPRIDNYICKTYPDIGKPKYQLKITASLKDYINLKDEEHKYRYEPYFGDHDLCWYDNIELNFNTYFDEALLEKIKAILPKVFALENFGSFSNKGYGCFTVENQNRDDFEKILKSAHNTIYYWDLSTTDDKIIFFQIKYFYSLLKSGINQVGKNDDECTYYKSLLMLYFLDKKIRWEKRGIKKLFNLRSTKNRTGKIDQIDKFIPDGENYQAVKPLLGFSESQEWLSYGLMKENKIKIEMPKGIGRINSPLFFKVFKENGASRIYFMLVNTHEFQKKLLPRKEFKFKIKNKTESFNTPESFDYSDFLNYAVNTINEKLTANSASGGTAQRVDNFIQKLITSKIHKL
ncbi:MAG: hypothetical protein PVH88_24140 [Ignavibacteria bacterium]|jgi:hypothetical protein